LVPSDEQPGTSHTYTVNGEVIRDRAETFKDEFTQVVNQPSKKLDFTLVLV